MCVSTQRAFKTCGGGMSNSHTGTSPNKSLGIHLLHVRCFSHLSTAPPPPSTKHMRCLKRCQQQYPGRILGIVGEILVFPSPTNYMFTSFIVPLLIRGVFYIECLINHIDASRDHMKRTKVWALLPFCLYVNYVSSFINI